MLTRVNQALKSAINGLSMDFMSQHFNLALSVNEATAVCLQLRKIYREQNVSGSSLSGRVIFSRAIRHGYKELLSCILTRSLYTCDVDAECCNEKHFIDIKNIALLRAADYGREDIAAVLLSVGAELNTKEHVGIFEQTQYELAGPLKPDAYDRYFDICECLHRSGYYDDTIDWMREAGLDYGHTPLIHAARRGSQSVVALLIEAKAKLQIRTACGFSAVMEAVSGRHVTVLQMLLAAKADPNLATDKKVTPLMGAVHVNSVECARLLLEAHADVSLKDREDCSARDYMDSNNTEMQKLFLRHGNVPGDATECKRPNFTLEDEAAKKAISRPMLKQVRLLRRRRSMKSSEELDQVMKGLFKKEDTT